jgi:hypothetical protein
MGDAATNGRPPPDGGALRAELEATVEERRRLLAESDATAAELLDLQERLAALHEGLAGRDGVDAGHHRARARQLRDAARRARTGGPQPSA